MNRKEAENLAVDILAKLPDSVLRKDGLTLKEHLISNILKSLNKE